MIPGETALRTRPSSRGLLLAAVLLVAFNMRGAIAAVAPVLPEIRSDLDLGGSAAGLLTTLPVLCFALLAPAAAWLGKRLGPEQAILLACLVIAAGTVVRVLGGPATLLAATVVIGAAMTVGNVLLPVVIKRDFAGSAARVTGLFTAALCAGAATTAALTAPVSAAAGWRVGTAGWAVLAVAAALLWWVAVGRRRSRATPPVDSAAPSRLWGSPLAWAVALFLGAQSTAYFTVTAWLPTFLVDRSGVDAETAGAGMAVFQILGIGGTLLISGIGTVRRQQSWLAGLVAGGWVVMLTGLLWWPANWLAWTVVGGFAQGAGIALALTFVVLRSHDADVARGLSGMAQLVGYTMAAVGPVAVGALNERTGSWTAPWVVLLAVAGCMALTGLVAGRDATVRAPAAVRQP